MSKHKSLGRIALAAVILLLVAVTAQSLSSVSGVQPQLQSRSGLAVQQQPLRPAGAPSNQTAADQPVSEAPNYTVLPNGTILGNPVAPGVSPNAEELAAIAKAKPRQQPDRSAVELEFESLPLAGHVDAPDPVVQESIVGNLMPAPSRSWTGMDFSYGNGGAPPDTSGDVGPNHYVQMINSAYVVLNKSGTVLAGPFDINTLWSNVGGACYNNNDGDPIVVHDQLADRWILTQFTSSAPYHECIAVSTTANPTGTFWVYSFRLNDTDFPDYPKFGVWPDGYYMGVNMFRNHVFQGTRPYVFERSRMLAGQAARWLSTTTALGNTQGLVIPSDLDGSTLPPTGAPNFFAQAAGSTLNIYKFKVDWNNTANSTWTGPTSLPVAAYTQLCNSCIPQPNTQQRLDGIGDRLMYRVAYRNYGSYEAMAVAMNVNANNFAAVRWYEVRNPNTTPTIHQQGTFGNTTDHRWMGSPAMDRSGNYAIGYSIGGPNRYPSVAYAGRLVSDPLGQLSQGEALIYSANGAQDGVNRWGDYSQLSIDPSDDCTFWYTTEYNESFGWNWSTRIGSFKFPSCGPPPPGPATSTPTKTNTPVPPTNTPTKTNTPVPTATKTFTAVPQQPTATKTFTAIPAPPTATRTFTAVPGQPTATKTFTAVPGQPTATRTATQVPGQATATKTFTAVPGQPTATRTATLVPGQPTATNTTTIPNPGQPTATPPVTACQIQFPDVPSTHPFYQFVRCLACRSILGGFSDGTFRPGANITRGQLSKVVANAAGFTEERGEHSFEDVPPGSAFHQFVERMYSRGIISGYACGGSGEPCLSGKPYFRPNANATRGQIAKIVSNAAGFSDDPGGQNYADIAVGSTFHTWVNRLSNRGAISGYACGGADEPCGAGNLPYFRPNANATRGQVAKIVSNTFFPNCQTP
jgi:hypothetical protein